MSKTERQLNLVFLLLNTKRGLTRSQIQEQLLDYRESPSQAAFERMFERDKEDIKELGFQLEANLNDMASSEEFSYRIIRDSSFVNFHNFSLEEKLVLQMSLIHLHKMNMFDLSLNLKLEANLKTLPVEVNLKKTVDGILLFQVIKAIKDRRFIFFEYLGISPNGNEEVTRKVTPLHLVVKNGFYYLIGYSHERENYRVFRMDRITRLLDVGSIDEALYSVAKKDDLINLLDSANPIMQGKFKIIENRSIDLIDFPGFNLDLDDDNITFDFRPSMIDSLIRYFAMNLDSISDLSPEMIVSHMNELLKVKSL
jgi:predicted DNA-binding transcriptional regulator YafY